MPNVKAINDTFNDIYFQRNFEHCLQMHIRISLEIFLNQIRVTKTKMNFNYSKYNK